MIIDLHAFHSGGRSPREPELAGRGNARARGHPGRMGTCTAAGPCRASPFPEIEEYLDFRIGHSPRHWIRWPRASSR